MNRKNDHSADAHAHYFNLYNLAPAGYLVVSGKGRILESNLAAATLLGATREFLTGKSVARFILKENQDIYLRCRQQLLDSGKPQRCELQMVRTDGSLLWADMAIAAAPDGNGPPVCRMVISDITEHKKTEAARQIKTFLFDASIAANSIAGLDGIITEVNDTFLQMWGYPDKKEIAGRPMTFFFNDPAEAAAMMSALETRGQWEGSYTAKKKDGTTFIANALATVMRNENGTLIGYQSSALDITARRKAEAERENLRDELRHAQKLEAVGQLAGGIAHDFNNLLMSIMGYAELGREDLPPKHPVREWLDEIIKDAQRSAAITRKLLAFARKQPVTPKVLDLNEAAEGTLKLLRRLIGEHIQLIWMPGANLWPLKIDPSQIDQIMVNLCVNARDAISGTGRVSIETANVTLDDAFSAGHAGSVPGDYVQLTVGDDGCGIKKDIAAHIFEPFFTTKAVGKGTGLGLATVYGIVKQNDGYISVDSEPGRGATFRIYLPRFTGKPGGAAAAGRLKMPKGHGETVLLVEDDETVRTVCNLSLESIGYNVLAAKTPAEALEIASRNGTIHLLLTDIIMPGMNGRKLAGQIAAARPEMKILFMSGQMAGVNARNGVLEDGASFIAKPFLHAEIARKVQEVLKN